MVINISTLSIGSRVASKSCDYCSEPTKYSWAYKSMLGLPYGGVGLYKTYYLSADRGGEMPIISLY